jgi:hypothetical protein
MNLSTLRRLATQVLIVIVALAAVLTSGAPAQSLGDVARKEEARRKETGSGKTYTNENLRSAPEPAAPAPSTSAAAPSTSAPSSAPSTTKPAATPDAKTGDAKAGDAPKGDAKPAADAKPDAAAWKKRREGIETALARAKTFADALQSQINGLTADFSARDDPAQRSRVAADRQKALTELDRVKKEIADHTKALADLQEEARKSGVPPGWLR